MRSLAAAIVALTVTGMGNAFGADCDFSNMPTVSGDRVSSNLDRVREWCERHGGRFTGNGCDTTRCVPDTTSAGQPSGAVATAVEQIVTTGKLDARVSA